MTGGQMAPTTLIGMKSATTPTGREVARNGYPLNITDLLAKLDGTCYVTRQSVHNVPNVRKTKKAIRKALENSMLRKGTSIVEIVSTCSSGWKMTPEESNNWMVENMQDLDIRGAGNMLGAEQSGFIADLGYETYQKILNEAVSELKDEEFSELYADEMNSEQKGTFITDCQIDTDLELLFSQDYIENISERITLYRELDNISNENELLDFQDKLTDRFGEIPDEGMNLMTVVRLRWLAIRLGFERLVLKNGQMTAFFVSNFESAYYRSEIFGKVISYISYHPRKCRLREQNGKRSVIFNDIADITKAWEVLKEI